MVEKSVSGIVTWLKNWFYDKTESDNKYIAKGNIQGGVNLLGQWQGDKKSGGNCSMPTRTYSVFHENPIDVIDNQSVSDTSDYSGMKYMIKASVFQPTDVFTFSFWAKGDADNTKNEIRAYFYNGMSVRRLYSNSDVDYGESASSSNDGATRFTLTTDWQLFTVTYQIKEGGTSQASKYPLIRVYGGCKCSVSGAKLERGFNATDYSPCDEIPINLNHNIDYNDYKNDGNYFVWGSQQTGNTNKPPNDTQGGLLTVKTIPDGCIQILYNYYLASPKIYYRIFHSTTGWRNWQTIYSSSQEGVPDTDVTWDGVATSNSVSPLLMATGEDFNANRLAYFPSDRMTIQYSTDGGTTWSTYSSIGTENKQRLCMNGYTAYLGNNSTTDRTKNRLRVTFDVGDMDTNSVLYMITRKIAVYSGTNNATGFTCQLQTQTYAQYNSNVETFSNYGSAFSLGGNSGWNSYPINFTLGGNAGSQTNTSSTRIKALRLVFTQSGGTGNGLVSRIRLYGETAYRTPSNYSNNGHIYYADVNQNAKFPNKIIKEGGTSSQILLANGDTKPTTDYANSTHNHSISDITDLVDTDIENYLTYEDLLNLIYPIGSIYINVNPTSPADTLGGYWVRIEDTFLLACGSTYSAGATGGEETHTLTVDEMPSHNHTYMHYQSNGSSTEYSTMWSSSTQKSSAKSTSNTGRGQAHNNMPPYLAVYVWKRVS